MASGAPLTTALLGAMAHAGARRYGAERVSELEHALQCAELAEASGADEEVTLACLLHDVGRVAVDQALVFDRVGGARPGTRGHHELGADFIAPSVPPRVTWLVRMHADAKRYICATEPGYHATLSPASQHTLTLHGGERGGDRPARGAPVDGRCAAPAPVGRRGEGGRAADPPAPRVGAAAAPVLRMTRRR